MLMRFDPWRDFDRLLWGGDARRTLPVDAIRRGDQVMVHFDVPGVDPDSIDLTVDRNVLTIKAERNLEPGEHDEVLMSERPRGTFVRRIVLGDSVDGDKLEAMYSNGVLTVVIPMAESAKPRKIEITSGEPTKELEAESKAA